MGIYFVRGFHNPIKFRNMRTVKDTDNGGQRAHGSTMETRRPAIVLLLPLHHKNKSQCLELQ